MQALAGSNANLAVYNALLNPGDTILSLYLPDGGHLSHGWSYPTKEEKLEMDLSEKVYTGGSRKVNIVSKFYNVIQYKTDPETHLIDYDFLEQLALQVQPKLIITGGTAYVRNIDYSRVAIIAKKVNSLYLADVAHEAGLIAAGALPSPIGIADIVTFTTHKTLRGPKGAVICAHKDVIEKVNKSIMPGLQGGPHNGTIAGIAQALFEADTKEFKEYAAQVIKNAQVMASEFVRLGYKLITGSTDKHLLLIDLSPLGITGKQAAYLLEKVGIITNMNTIPYEKGSPANPSGLRLGTPSITTRGLVEKDVIELTALIDRALKELVNSEDKDLLSIDSLAEDSSVLKNIRDNVGALVQKHPFK